MMGSRKFEDHPATREQVPLFVGLIGASSSGKTVSALRLALGMQRVAGGEIYLIDTETRRALHYADRYSFRHVEFKPPYSPEDYRAAFEHCAAQGAKVIIGDSMSHEHDGPGGVLEWHERELDRMAGEDFKKRERCTFAAWAKPKDSRRKLMETILGLGVCTILCYRAKRKLRIRTGHDPVDLGWMPIAAEEFAYEMTVNALLYPGSGGVPTWESDYPGERVAMKKPVQFVDLFAKSKPLDEATGEALATWARGGEAPARPAPEPVPESSPPIAHELLDEIKRVFLDHGLAGSETEAMESRHAALNAAFGTPSWPEVTRLDVDALNAGIAKLHEHLAASAADRPPPCATPIGDDQCGLDTGHKGKCKSGRSGGQGRIPF